MNRKAKVLITGGAGFIGSHLANNLSENNFDVLVVDNLSKGKKDNLNKDITLVDQDIQTEKFLKTFQKFKPDYLFHLAAQTNIAKSQEDPKAEFEINFLPIIKILDAAKKTNLKKIIFSSSAAVYGDCKVLPIKENSPVNPISPYGISKLATENYIKCFSMKFKLPYVVLRYANVFGPKQDFTNEGGVVAIFITKMLNGKDIQINGTGKQTRDFIFVEDVVNANKKSLNEKITGVYNIGTSSEVPIATLYKKIKMLVKTKSKAKYVKTIPSGVSRSALSSSFFQKKSGFKVSVDFTTGLEKTINYFKRL